MFNDYLKYCAIKLPKLAKKWLRINTEQNNLDNFSHFSHYPTVPAAALWCLPKPRKPGLNIYCWPASWQAAWLYFLLRIISFPAHFQIIDTVCCSALRGEKEWSGLEMKMMLCCSKVGQLCVWKPRDIQIIAGQWPWALSACVKPNESICKYTFGLVFIEEFPLKTSYLNILLSRVVVCWIAGCQLL